LLSFVGAVYAVVLKLAFPQVSVSGWTLLMVTTSFIGGIQLLTLGIVGTYIGRIYSEVQARPLYLVASVHSRHHADAETEPSRA
jgi:dolichol-phosphate mannosyltransferase